MKIITPIIDPFFQCLGQKRGSKWYFLKIAHGKCNITRRRHTFSDYWWCFTPSETLCITNVYNYANYRPVILFFGARTHTIAISLLCYNKKYSVHDRIIFLLKSINILTFYQEIVRKFVESFQIPFLIIGVRDKTSVLQNEMT